MRYCTSLTTTFLYALWVTTSGHGQLLWGDIKLSNDMRSICARAISAFFSHTTIMVLLSPWYVVYGDFEKMKYWMVAVLKINFSYEFPWLNARGGQEKALGLCFNVVMTEVHFIVSAPLCGKRARLWQRTLSSDVVVAGQHFQFGFRTHPTKCTWCHFQSPWKSHWSQRKASRTSPRTRVRSLSLHVLESRKHVLNSRLCVKKRIGLDSVKNLLFFLRLGCWDRLRRVCEGLEADDDRVEDWGRELGADRGVRQRCRWLSRSTCKDLGASSRSHDEP